MQLYHFTHKNNLNSIVFEGLKVNSGGRGLVQRPRYHQRFGCRPIFLTNDPEYVKNVMMDDSKEMILLKITDENIVNKVIPENEFYKNSPYLCNKIVTFICFHNIDAGYLEIMEH